MDPDWLDELSLKLRGWKDWALERCSGKVIIKWLIQSLKYLIAISLITKWRLSLTPEEFCWLKRSLTHLHVVNPPTLRFVNWSNFRFQPQLVARDRTAHDWTSSVHSEHPLYQASSTLLGRPFYSVGLAHTLGGLLTEWETGPFTQHFIGGGGPVSHSLSSLSIVGPWYHSKYKRIGIEELR